MFPAYNSISFKRDNVTFEEKAASRKVDKKSTIVGKGFANAADAFVVALCESLIKYSNVGGEAKCGVNSNKENRRQVAVYCELMDKQKPRSTQEKLVRRGEPNLISVGEDFFDGREGDVRDKMQRSGMRSAVDEVDWFV